MRSLSTSAFGQPSETKLTRGGRSLPRVGLGFSMGKGPSRAYGWGQAPLGRPQSGTGACDGRHCIFIISAYMEGVARDRAADRGCTGGGEVADDVGPPGEIPRGFRFLGCVRQQGPSAIRGWMSAGTSVFLAPPRGRN